MIDGVLFPHGFGDYMDNAKLVFEQIKLYNDNNTNIRNKN